MQKKKKQNSIAVVKFLFSNREKIKELLKTFRAEDFLVDEVQTEINLEKYHHHHHDEIENWFKYPGEFHKSHRRNTQSVKFYPSSDEWKVNSNLRRVKRQQQSGNDENLCTSRTSFLNPQAALNSRGNWMFLVNNGDSPTQLIRTESCA